MDRKLLRVALAFTIALAALALAVTMGSTPGPKQIVAAQAPAPDADVTLNHSIFIPLAIFEPPPPTPTPEPTDTPTPPPSTPIVGTEPYTAALRNGGFEEDWSTEESHDVTIFETDGTVEEAERGNIFTPPGWVTWFKHGLPVDHDPTNDDGWGQPEVRDAWIENDEYRVHTGEKGQLLFTFYRVHDAGFMQQVPVTVGETLELTGWAHAWSNNGTYDSDPRWSEGEDVGYNEFFALEGDDGLDVAEMNFTFWLGIDPTGGTDPFTDTVEWSTGAHIYNAYHQVPTVTVTAQGPTATVFIRSRTLWRNKHNDAYWDDITLKSYP